MAAEDIIQRIVSKRKDLSVEDIKALIEAKKQKSGGYLTDEIAARIVAAELGIEIPTRTPRLKVLIKNLVSGLGKVTVVGRVVAVYPPRVFTDPLGTERKTSSLLMADKTGIIRITLWNDEVELIENLKIRRGKIIRVSNGYILEGKDGNLELRLGRRGKIEVSPEDIREQEYPAIPRLKNIREITLKQRNRRISLIGKIREKSSLSSFERRNGSLGQFIRLVLTDETGTIPIVAWNEQAKTIEKTDLNNFLLLVNAKVKERIDHSLEIHVDHRTYVEVLDEDTLKQIVPKKKLIQVSEIKHEGKLAVLEGHVSTKPFLREVNTSKGETVRVTTFEVSDGTGKIWVSAWRTLADLALNLCVGDQVRIENVRIKKGFKDELEISTISSTRFWVKDKKKKKWKLLSPSINN
jgi:replication factor A1